MKTSYSKLLALQKPWLADALNGRWSALISIQGNEMADALRCRALLMVGNLDQAETIVNRALTSGDPGLQVLWDLCRCHLRFVRGNYQGALFYANRAYLRAKNPSFPELLADASFYRALCLTELDEKYQALALYKTIRRTKSITDYRRNLVLTNEAWLLWDLGLIAPLTDIAAEIPRPFGERIRVLLGILEGQVITNTTLDTYLLLPLIEKENLFLIVLESILVLGGASALSDFQQTLFFKDIVHSSQSLLIKHTLDLLQGNESEMKFSGRDQIDGLFIKSLILARTQKPLASALYFEGLVPLMKTQRYYSPFMPTEVQCNTPRNAWERAMASIFTEETLPQKRKIEILVDEKALRFSESTLKFQQSPTTWSLLLAFEKKQSLTKEQIHELLTNNRYRSDLHDTRIFKLVQRINTKAKKHFGFELCRFNGANELEVCCDFVRGQQ